MFAEADRLTALYRHGLLDTPPEPVFDRIVDLARTLCRTQIALVSLVDADRQWFKAGVGVATRETARDTAVCDLVVAARDWVEIRDLSADERTREMALVAGAEGLRFYAGAPLIDTQGAVLGSLCVIDREPRPEGLSAEQRSALTLLAAQTVSLIEMRSAIGARDVALARDERVLNAREALEESERRFHTLFNSIDDGFCVIRFLDGPLGPLSDYVHVEANAAFAGQLGVPDIVGRTLRDLVDPAEADGWVELYGEVLRTGEPIRFQRRFGPTNRELEVACLRIEPASRRELAVVFKDVTERVRAVEALARSATQKSALLELGDHLRTAHTAEAMSFAAAHVMGRILGACRAGYGAVDARQETIEISPDWCAPGVASIAGAHSFRSYGSYIDDLKHGVTVVIADAQLDPRTAGAGAQALESLRTRALVNSPVVEDGRLVSLSFVHFDRPREIDAEEQAFIRQVADRTQVSIARLQAEERQSLLNGEVSHRLKNILAMVQAVASQTLRGRAEPEAIQAFDQRLAALSRAQDALLRNSWQAADLAYLASEVMTLAGASERTTIDGPAVQLGSRATLSTSLLLHELATNAQKYGALSRSAGRVLIEWRTEGDPDNQTLVLRWIENGGPPATPPTRKGFGSRLVRGGLLGTGGSDTVFGEEGFSAFFRAPLRQVEQA